MAPKLNSDFIKQQQKRVKLVLRGRRLAFGVVAKGPRLGLFRVSKIMGEVNKKDKLRGKKVTPYDESGKDAKAAKEFNDGEKMPFAFGVCEFDNGTKILKLLVLKGTEKGVYEKLVRHFVVRLLRLKMVKDVELKDQDALPELPLPDAPDGEKLDAKDILKRAESLGGRLTKVVSPENVGKRLGAAKTEKDLEKADSLLDDVEAAIVLLETARNFKNAQVLAGVQEKLKSWDFDGAEKILDSAAGIDSESGETSSNGKHVQDARKAWETKAKEADGQVDKLRKELDKLNDPQLKDIATNGLNKLDDGYITKLGTALDKLEIVPNDAGVKKVVTALIGQFGGHLGKDERIKVCDDNPFKVPVTYQKTMNEALKALATAVNAPAKK